MTSGQHLQDTRVPTWRTKASATPPTSVLFVFFVLFVANSRQPAIKFSQTLIKSGADLDQVFADLDRE
jgi:hypothetical protein